MNLSHANTILRCPAYVRLCKQRKRQMSQAALDGIELHKEAQDYLQCGTKSTNPDVQMYIDYVKNYAFNGELLIEHRMTVPTIHPEARGVVDAAFYNDDTITVIDLKTGWTEVPAIDNYQLIAYAKGISDNFAPSAILMSLQIVQPKSRLSKIKTWTISKSELDLYIGKLRQAAYLSDLPNPPVKTGSHCINCDHKTVCPAISKTIDILGDIVETQFEECEDYDISMRIKQLKYLKKLAEKSLILEEEKAISMISAGRTVKGLKVDSIQGNMIWADKEAAFKTLKIFGQLNAEKSMITPKQAIAAGVPVSVVNKLSSFEDSKIRLKEM